MGIILWQPFVMGLLLLCLCRSFISLCWSVSCWRRRRWPWSLWTGKSLSCATSNFSSKEKCNANRHFYMFDGKKHAVPLRALTDALTQRFPCRALRVRKKMSGDRMPVKMIGDILTNQLPHMQPYIRLDLDPFPCVRNVCHASCCDGAVSFLCVCGGSVRVSWMGPRWFSRRQTIILRSKISSR